MTKETTPEEREAHRAYMREYRMKRKLDGTALPPKKRVKSEAEKERNRQYMRGYSIDKADQIKAYRDANQELIKELGASYRAEHREELNECRRAWGEANKDRVATKNREWREENPERALDAQREWRERYPERQSKSSKQWRDANGARVAWHVRERQARIKIATPAWADWSAMNKRYEEARTLTEETGTLYVVDHVVPLNHELVCGLHCEANLQVITGSENSSKGNKFLIE